MTKKLNCILLIDDDEPTNFVNEMALQEANCAERIVSVQSGKAALEFLANKDTGAHPQPDLIFLDINMPAMNGWEFLEEYKKLPIEQKGNIVVIMLTTSLNPDDATKAADIAEINDFRNKPVSSNMLHDLILEHFPELSA